MPTRKASKGKFFVWTIEEAREALAPLSESLPRALEIAVEYFGMSAEGNFEGSNILFIPRPPAETAEVLGITLEQLADAIAQIKRTTLRRPQPADSAAAG